MRSYPATLTSEQSSVPGAAGRRRPRALSSAAPVLVVAVLALLVAACGGSSGGLPATGYGSPAAAVSGFVQGLQAGNNDAACNYVVPSQQSQCKSTYSGVKFQFSNVSIGNVATSGSEAIVALVTTKACVGDSALATTTTCISNSDKNQGLPSSPSGFQSAFQNAVGGGSSTSLTTACEEVDGKWYVDPGLTSGTTGTTGTTGGGTAGTTGSGTTGTGTTGTTGAGTTGTTGSGSTGTTGTTGSGTTGSGVTGTTGTTGTK